jgi:carbamoyltransferase
LGPRALGQRSIIASPISSDMKDRINNGVKFREPFRPFAPVVPEELASDWFDFGNSPIQSPFMLRAVPFRVERAADVPAVVHVDGSGRLQTLTEEDNGPLHGLALRFQAKTGIPILLNTSFNLKDEPIAETPEDAIWTLLATAMQFCVIGDQLVTKTSEIDSVLDLTPRVIAKSWTLKLPVEHGRLGRQSTAEDAFTFRVDTPWGETDIILPARLAPVVSAIDGLSNGHGMLDRLPAEERGIRQLIHDLLLLRRVRVIALENPAA